MDGTAGRAAQTGDRVPCRRRFEEVGQLRGLSVNQVLGLGGAPEVDVPTDAGGALESEAETPAAANGTAESSAGEPVAEEQA